MKPITTKPMPLPFDGLGSLPATTFYRSNTGTHIRADVDKGYRDGLRALMAQDAGRDVRMMLERALGNGPSVGGYEEAARYFGPEFDVKLKLTAPVIDACEIAMPGFKRWLELSGFGNDKTMIRAMVKWAEDLNERVRTRPTLIDDMRRCKQ